MNNLISIIIVSYNSLSYLKLLLNSIKVNTLAEHELIIIDNNSLDDTRKWLNENYKDLGINAVKFTLILNKENKGYSGACNQGIDLASGDYIIFLNSDIIVTYKWLIHLSNHLNLNPDAGIVGPIASGIGGKQNYMSVYKDIRYSNPLLDLNNVSREIYINNRGNNVKTKFLIGCCYMVKRKVFEKIGKFDPNLFMSADDFDFSLRTRMAGYKLYVVEDVIIHHFDHRSFNSLSREQERSYIDRGWKNFYNKWQNVLVKYTMDDLFYNEKMINF
jgi:GT2 family glycosyltransferase